jgi:hypothetical protein
VRTPARAPRTIMIASVDLDQLAKARPSGAVPLVGVAKSADLANGNTEQLGSFHGRETPLEHAANDFEAIDFLRAQPSAQTSTSNLSRLGHRSAASRTER